MKIGKDTHAKYFARHYTCWLFWERSSRHIPEERGHSWDQPGLILWLRKQAEQGRRRGTKHAQTLPGSRRGAALGVTPPLPHTARCGRSCDPHFTVRDVVRGDQSGAGVSQLTGGRAAAGTWLSSQHTSLGTGGGLHSGKLRAETVTRRETTGRNKGRIPALLTSLGTAPDSGPGEGWGRGRVPQVTSSSLLPPFRALHLGG